MAYSELRGVSNVGQLAARWLATCLLYFVVTFLFFMVDATINQPHPIYISGTWLTYELPKGLVVSCVSAGVIGVIAAAHMALQWWRRSDADYDFAFYPTIDGILRARQSAGPRLIMIVGATLLAVYFGLTQYDQWLTEQRPHGIAWPAYWMFVILMLSWCVLWIADCLTRPRRGITAAAAIFTFFSLALLLPFAGPGAVE